MDTLEADPRHAEIVIKELGLEGGKAIKVPGAKAPKEEQDEEKIEEQWQEAEELNTEDARRYRAVAARLNYLAVDKADIKLSVKEAARAMSAPLK